jgi:hypothetical protein
MGMMTMITMEGGLGGVGPCLFPTDWDANESLSGKGSLLHYLVTTAGLEEAASEEKPRKTLALTGCVRTQVLSEAPNEKFIDYLVVVELYGLYSNSQQEFS